MGTLTKWGSQFGTLPISVGAVYFVAPSASYTVNGLAFSASDNNDGLSPERALLTISQAISNATASAGDVIALLPGTHTTASAAALSKAGLTFVGLPYFPQAAVSGYVGWQPQVTITGTAATAIAVTAADCVFYNIRFLSVTQQISVSLVTAAHRTKFVHCMIDNTGITGHANTRGIITTTANAPRGVSFLGCLFKDASVTTSCGAALNLAAAPDFWLYKCTIYKDGAIASGVAWTTAIVIEDLSTGTFEEVNAIISEVSVGITKVITGATMTGAGTIHAIRCTSTVNTGGLLLDDFAAADVDLCLNYVATVAGGTGGTLITATT
jgi:hypothetical protein